MPPNRVVHHLLTGRKRKAQTVDTTPRADCNSDDNGNRKSDTENIHMKMLSSAFPPQLLSKPLSTPSKNQVQPQYSNTNSKRQLLSPKSTNQIQPQNNHSVGRRTKVMVGTNKMATAFCLSSKQGKAIVKTKFESSTVASQRFPDRIEHRPKDLQQHPRKLSNQQQHWLRNRCKQRFLRDNKRKLQGEHNKTEKGCNIEIRDRYDGASMSINDNQIIKNDQFKRLESLVATRQPRQRSMKMKLYSNTIPLASKNDSFAELLIREFLEQRNDYRITSSHMVLSTCSSPFDDPMIFPVMLLGVCTLCRLTEWYDQKQEDEAFSHSPIVRDLVLWMKDRQELHTTSTSETIQQKHVDALNQLAKFHESIEDSHEMSLRLREEEAIDNHQQRSQKQRYSEVERTARAERETKTEACRFRLDELHESPKEYADIYHLTDRSDNPSLKPRQQKSGKQPYFEQRPLKCHQHLEVNNLTMVSNLKFNHGSIRSKQDREPSKTVETAAVQTTTKNIDDNISEIDISEENVEGKILCLSNKSNTMTQLASGLVTTLSSSPIPSDDTDQRPNINPQLDDDNDILISSISSVTKKRSPLLKLSSPDSFVASKMERFPFRVIETERIVQQPNQFQPDAYTTKFEIKPNSTILHTGPIKRKNTLDDFPKQLSVLTPNNTEGNYLSLDKTATVTTSSNVLKENSRTKEIRGADTTTDTSIFGKSQITGGVYDIFMPCEGNEIVCQNRNHFENKAGGYNASKARSITNHPVSTSRPAHRPKSRCSSISISTKCLAEENENGGGVEHKDYNWDVSSYSSSDDTSEVLLSQSQKRIPKSRRVTASPRTLSDSKARRQRERYKHYSKTDFSGQSQNSGDRSIQDFEFSCPSRKEKSQKRKSCHKQLSLHSSQETWVSRAPKRSPSFKQTSLISSTGGWVSNQRARSFVKHKSSPQIQATVIANQNQYIDPGKRNPTKQKRDFSIRKDDDKYKTSFCTVTLGRDDIFEDPNHGISCFPNDNRNVALTTTKEVPASNFSALVERKNPTARLGEHRRTNSVSKKDNFIASIDFDISTKGVEKSDENNKVANTFKYEEVVRGKVAREALSGYECEECAAFFDEAVLHGDGAKYYDRDELLRCSRHRGRQTPPQTPEDYWELSFLDEKKERLRQEAVENN